MCLVMPVLGEGRDRRSLGLARQPASLGEFYACKRCCMGGGDGQQLAYGYPLSSIYTCTHAHALVHGNTLFSPVKNLRTRASLASAQIKSTLGFKHLPVSFLAVWANLS